MKNLLTVHSQVGIMTLMTTNVEFEHILCDKTEVGPVSIHTITQYEHRIDRTITRTYTLVATADGQDIIVKPNGDHVDISVDPSQAGPRVERVVRWIMENV